MDGGLHSGGCRDRRRGSLALDRKGAGGKEAVLCVVLSQYLG